MCAGIVKNVTEYAVTVGETVRNRVQDTVRHTTHTHNTHTHTAHTRWQQPMSFVSEFREEQERFARERQRLRDAAVPPWVGYQEEEQMKAQILELSADSRNVLRNPPPGVQFHFDFAKSYPVAMAMLKEDSRLQKLRFDLVPKKSVWVQLVLSNYRVLPLSGSLRRSFGTISFTEFS